ncbi:MAG: site-specific DNA-methyltransferase [Psychroflexus sp.]|nr:site-specific DNA-methyltransferase [Psychroflexus sp.]
MKNKILHGDCLELMKDIPDKSIDAIICDLPYGTTACKWDSVIPFEPLWEQYKRIIKDNGAIVLFGSEPFSSALRMSNIKNFKYDWIWEKNRGSNFALVKYQPMKEHEMISVFSFNTHKYYPIKQQRKGSGLDRINGNYNTGKASNITGIKQTICTTQGQELRQPSSIQKFNTTEKGIKRVHPTQKPLELLKYLVKTYTNEGDLVLDNTAGSGTTAIACLNTNRQFIVMEKEKKYYDIILNRVKEFNQKLF